MVNYEEVSKIFYEQLKDELERKPLTAAELNNPMDNDKKEALFNAIFCYDKQNKLCGFNIQPRIEQNEIYKLRYYIPLVDNSWVGVKTVDELPDKEVKVGFEGEYLSQNELLKNNDNELAKAMYFNFDVFGVVKLAEGLVGIDSSNVLYLILKRFKNAGYPINEATKQLNESKLFV
jgi:hypothetical protein